MEYLTVLLMLVAVQFSALDRRSYWVLNSGLTLWILSGVLDVLDEIVQQPVWLGNLEDVLRAIGMVMCAWAASVPCATLPGCGAAALPGAV
ncbi:hypothetical protein O0544_15370 [Edwardsiella anguillarum]|nr:hypothetical protein [Edwardsiella anguillarum]